MAVFMVQGADIPENLLDPEFAAQWAPLPNPGPPSVKPWDRIFSAKRGVFFFGDALNKHYLGGEGDKVRQGRKESWFKKCIYEQITAWTSEAHSWEYTAE